MAPVRKKRPAGPFSKEQEIWIVMEFGACRNITKVRRNFRKQYQISGSRHLPQRIQFQRIVDRFMSEGVQSTERKNGPASTITEDLVETCAKPKMEAHFNTF